MPARWIVPVRIVYILVPCVAATSYALLGVGERPSWEVLLVSVGIVLPATFLALCHALAAVIVPRYRFVIVVQGLLHVLLLLTVFQALPGWMLLSGAILLALLHVVAWFLRRSDDDLAEPK
ncbi:MAG: hypothetical protein FJ271_07510 [Planctomycetes bacterium]|nr:hypothetical protein [Planctomycetota bacterium]